MSDVCRKCGRPLIGWARTSDGFSPCRYCRDMQKSIWYHRSQTPARRAAKREYAREWRKRNPGYDGHKKAPPRSPVEKVREYKRRHREKNRDTLNAKSREYYWRNREKILQQKRLRDLKKVKL